MGLHAYFCGLLIPMDILLFKLDAPIYNANGNMSEYPFYCRICIRNIPLRGLVKETRAKRLIGAFWSPDFRSCVVLPRKFMKIISLPRSSLLAFLSFLSPSFFCPGFLSCSWRSHPGPGAGYIPSYSLVFGEHAVVFFKHFLAVWDTSLSS